MITVIEPRVDLITPVSHLVDYSKIIEKCGRVCYKSEDNITNDSAKKFIKSIVKRGHLSVIEHCSVTFKITCDRSCSHQLVRHRLAAFSQESQRFCDYGKLGLKVIMPPTIKALDKRAQQFWLDGRELEYREYQGWRKMGIPPEDARSCLPNACKTEVVTTFNLRMWRHVLQERWLNKHAQWQIKQVMHDIAYELYSYIPIFFEDLIDQHKTQRKTI